MIENTISIDCTDDYKTVANDTEDETKVQNSNFCAEDAENILCNTGMPETDEVSAVQTTEKPDADQQEGTVELTLYGEKRNVPLSQAIAAAQKGMAFDHIKAQLADMKNDYRLKALDQLALSQGKDAYQFLSELQHRALAEELMGRYGSLENAPLEELSRAAQTLMQSQKQLAQSKSAADYHHWKNQLADFVAENPGCREIPHEVITAAKKGEKLTDAYSRLYGTQLAEKLKEAKRELEILKSENTAAKNSTPSAKSTGGQSPKENEYLKFMKSTW